MALLQQDVLRLDVTVEHVAAMRVVEGARDLARDAHRVSQGQLPLAAQAFPQ